VPTGLLPCRPSGHGSRLLLPSSGGVSSTRPGRVVAALFGVWSRLTDSSRRALRLAQERSIAAGGECVETEDVAVGLLAEAEGIAAVALTKFGLGTEEAIAHAKWQRRAGEERAAGATRFSRPVKMALECALQEAYFLGQHHADTEHVLLGLLRAMRVFPDSGFALVVGLDNQLGLRSEIRRLIASRDLRDGA
jgi:Clp amino terminal domain, pathogenicity island component